LIKKYNYCAQKVLKNVTKSSGGKTMSAFLMKAKLMDCCFLKAAWYMLLFSNEQNKYWNGPMVLSLPLLQTSPFFKVE